MDQAVTPTLQQQLKARLTARMESREWPPGSKLPSERELCAEYGVSRMTVRETLHDLAREGLVTRQQGRGTFVSMPKIEQNLSRFYSFSEEIRRRGLTPNTRVLQFGTLVAEPHIAQALGLGTRDQVFLIERLRLIEETPFAWERSYVPFLLAPVMTREGIEQDGLYATLLTMTGRQANQMEETFEAVGCPAGIAAHLGMKKSDAILRLTRRALSDGMPMEYCESFIRSDAYKYKITLEKKEST